MNKRRSMSTNDAIAVWGCVVSANVCGSTGELLGFAMGAVWLVFALVILYASPDSFTADDASPN